MSANAQGRPIIIRRKKVIHVKHGGSWKIALADFMTALMALFLVLWLLGTTSTEELEGIAEYFRTPLKVAITGGERVSETSSVIPGGGADPVHIKGERARIDYRVETRPADARRHFHDLQHSIEAAMEADPELRDLRHQVRFDITPEGLLMQFLDTERRPMFELGSDRISPYMRKLLRTIAPILNSFNNEISITGHTDSLSYAAGKYGYSNWELSTDRANASRRELMAGGLDPDKLLRVTGLADRLPLADANPSDPINRRIALHILSPQAVDDILGKSAVPALLPEVIAEGVLEETASDRATSLDQVKRQGLQPNIQLALQ